MKTYVIEDVIQLGILITRGGLPKTGKTVYANVHDVTDLTTPLLGSQLLTESVDVTGFYYYDWSHTLTAKTFMVVTYEVDTRSFTEDLLIDEDVRHFIDFHDADFDGHAL